MTRVFVLNHYPVLPARNGGQCTVKALARELAHDWPVELIWLERKVLRKEVIEEPDRRWGVTVLPNRWIQRKVSRSLRHFTGRNDADLGSLLFSGGNRQLVRHLLASSQDGDVFYLAHPFLWPALRRVLKVRRATLVYDAHNVEYVLKREALRPNAVSRWFINLTRRTEAEILARADLTLACTPLDADELARLGNVPRADLLVGIRGVEPSARADSTAALRCKRAPGKRALFVGSHHPPNDEAARWIIDTLAPSMPDWHFDIAGACGLTCGRSPSTPNVRVLGPVDDLSALMAEADVGLNPIVTGSGINMKVFEYLQHGLPVVSTRFGTRGFEDVAVVRVSELADFSSELRLLEKDLAMQRRLAGEGPLLVGERYTWPAVGRRLRTALAAVLARRAVP